MMLVATFGPSTAWEGREIIWDEYRFVLVGHGTIPAAGLLDYDRRGQLLWASPELRAWAFSVAQWEARGRQASPAAGARAASGPGARSGLPAWAIALIVVGVCVVGLGIASAFVIPALVFRAADTFSSDFTVSSGVRTVQNGVESWAADHGGSYPKAVDVNAAGLSRYISSWPTNPYTELPMEQGMGQGDFLYELDPGGFSYRLVGYGRDGKVTVELRGGPQTY